MKRFSMLALLLLLLTAGCVTDPHISELKIDSDQVAKQFVAGKTPVTCHAYGFVPNLYSACLAGYVVDVMTSDIHGFNFADIYTQNNSVQGLNISALFSNTGTLDGVSIVGLYSASDEQNILEIAGLCAKTKQVNGVQLAGCGALSDNLSGVQLGGLVAAARRPNGVQIAGLWAHCGNWRVVNNCTFQCAAMATAYNLNGAQIAAYNHARDELNGFQLGGVNFTNKISAGVQIGAINISRERDREFVDTITEVDENGAIVQRDIYRDVRFKSWQFGLLNRTSSGWWIPVTNFGLF